MKEVKHRRKQNDYHGAKKTNRKSKQRSNHSEDDLSFKESRHMNISRREKLDLIRLEEMAELEDLIEVYN